MKTENVEGTEAESMGVITVKTFPATVIGNAKVSESGSKELEARMFNRQPCPPPINNIIVPDIFNKLDAQVKEKTRAFDSILKQRLRIQEKVIRRHRALSEKFYNKQQTQIRNDLRRIEKRLPSFLTICRDITKSRLEKLESMPAIICTTKSLPILPPETKFCYRYFDHHNPARMAQKISCEIEKDIALADTAIKHLGSSERVDVPIVFPAVETTPSLREDAVGVTLVFPAVEKTTTPSLRGDSIEDNIDTETNDDGASDITATSDVSAHS